MQEAFLYQVYLVCAHSQNYLEICFGSGFAGWWQQVVCLLLFLGLPPIVMRRLEDAYINERYERD